MRVNKVVPMLETNKKDMKLRVPPLTSYRGKQAKRGRIYEENLNSLCPFS